MTSATIRRAFDVLAAAVILLVVAPAMLGIWVIVRLDGGPGLSGTMRSVREGCAFRRFKFRTAVRDADSRQIPLDFEPTQYFRMTPIGRVLRAGGLDELPQLINVLRGEMSLFGPSPLVPRPVALRPRRVGSRNWDSQTLALSAADERTHRAQ